MKKEFIVPSVDIFAFESVDIITASANDEELYSPNFGGGDIIWEDEMSPNG